MKNKIAALWLSFALVFSFILIIDVAMDFTQTVKGTTLYVNETGGGGAFKSIQDAINASKDGDTVFVFNGTYFENVVINKTINFTGEDKNTTIINGEAVDDVIRIIADWVNVSGFTVNNSGHLVFPDYDAGLELYNAQNCSIINNQFSNNKFGILLSSSTNNSIKDNIVTSNSMNGIWLIASPYNQIINNRGILNNGNGIYLSTSSNNIITNNIVHSNHQSGIYVYTSSDNIINANNISLNEQHGIHISDSSNINIINNYIYLNTQYGLYHYGSLNTTILNNEFVNDGIVFEGGQVSHYNSHNIPGNNLVNGKFLYYYKNCRNIIIDGSSIEAGELILANCSEIILRDFNISGTDVGIEFGFTSNTTLKNNNLSYNNHNGIILLYSSYNIIADNKITWNSESGINILEYSNNNNITINSVSNNEYGIHLLRSSNNFISYNNILSNGIGIMLETSLSNQNMISSNNVSKNEKGIILYWGASNNLINKNTILWNTVFGLALDWASNNNIANNNISNSWNGIILSSPSVNNVINGNNISNNEKGISLITFLTNNNTIRGNNVFSNNASNIYFELSSDNILDNNTISESKCGIHLTSSSDNVITGNNILSNECGINLSSSSNNKIYHNNFFKNTNHAYDNQNDNYWDNGYPSGGNFWSDYIGVDDYNGPNQDIPGSDRIGDTKYIIDSDSKDNYPLMGDENPPDIQLISPSNNSIIKPGTMIYLFISDPYLDMVRYSINDGTEQSLVPPYDIDSTDWDDGNSTVEIYAVDLYDNSNITWYNFTIDSISPTITLNSPLNNSFIKVNEEINLTISDANLNQITYSKNNDSPIPLFPPYNINTSSWPDGEYNITVYSDDKAGNFNEKWFFFTKDTILPEITLNSPNNDSLLMQASTLDFDILDENLKSVNYSINQDSYVGFEEPYDLDTTDWEDGSYIITIRAEDAADNTQEKWFVFRIDTSPPSAISSSPENEGLDVAVNAEIIIEFSEPMDTESVESAISINPYMEYSCSWSNENKTLTLNFSEPLEYKTLYQISISTKAKDLANRELENRYEFGFTTIDKPKEKGDEEGFPVIYLLGLLLAIVVAVIIVFLVLAKKKKKVSEEVETEVEVLETPSTFQVRCSNCNNLLQVTDTGMTMNVTCPFCSTILRVESKKAPAQEPPPQKPTIKISCPKCSHRFTISKTEGTIQVQCPSCGTKGTIK